MAIRLSAKPKVLETALRVAADLQRRYDLLFLRLGTPKPVRLTGAVRWGILNSNIPAHAWKSPVPTQVIEDYLTYELVDQPVLSVGEDWVQVVNKFISRCDYLENATEPEPRPSFRNNRPRAVRPRASSGASSEGHVSPESYGPSKKVVHYDN